jgi:hypothetical protein
MTEGKKQQTAVRSIDASGGIEVSTFSEITIASNSTGLCQILNLNFFMVLTTGKRVIIWKKLRIRSLCFVSYCWFYRHF